MATTPNYGWVTPAPTDFVTDLPADFEVFADAVDADLAGLLGGTTGQVLTKVSGTDHDFAFATPGGAPAKNFSLLNAGGTALTGAATVTVSSISGQDDLLILVRGASSVNASSTIGIRLNTDTGNNYFGAAVGVTGETGMNANSVAGGATGTDSLFAAVMSNNAGSVVTLTTRIFGCNSAGLKVATNVAGANAVGGSTSSFSAGMTHWNGVATVNSVSVFSSSGNFDAGTIYVYGSA